jgi:predicted Ser/Thr protein kinase
MGDSGSDDELARTATAATDRDAAASPELSGTLGRYRLERKLGEGGMGVVHAAFDPDLERRVALKVLRSTADGDTDARQRLLREARAMARLTHANVVTVHEVGSASGRDYVAMELIDGDSLADWLRATKHAQRDIIAAFIAAGRGLAAAHANGLVHRDFKPHNVLRRRDGRIVVTDFGLARGVDAISSGAFEATMDLRARSATAPNTPSSLSGLTATGSVLGTPAYMAPEQWSAGSIGPAADQFAFCVALWEALAGARPYVADTIDELKASIARGPGELDASKLPRRLRALLRRGLEPDPAKRWPSMDALLAAVVRGERRPAIAMFAAAGGVIAAAAIYLAVRPGAARDAPCDPPPIDVATVWPVGAGNVFVAAGRGELGHAFERDIAAWGVAREAACRAHNTSQLACYDGVLARADAIRRAIEKVSGEITDVTIASLVDPAVCTIATPPRLTLRSSPDTIAALALLLDGSRRDTTLREADAATFAARAGLDPCSRAVALLAVDAITRDVPRGKAATGEATTAADACGDDRLRADALIAATPYEYESPLVGPRGRAALHKAKIAVDRVAQPDLIAAIDQHRSNIAAQEEHWADAFAAAEAAVVELAARGRTRAQLAAVEFVNSLRFRRNAAGDMAAVRAAVAKWKPIAETLHEDQLVRGLEGSDAYARLFLGDLVGAHPEILRLWRPRSHPDVPTQRIDGTVVDEAGHPVAGATVATGPHLFADSIAPLPFGDAGDMRIVTTDAHGAFTISDAPMVGLILAQSDVRHRSEPRKLEPSVRLVLGPTRRIAGKVDLADTPHTKAFVMATPTAGSLGMTAVLAPIQPDGTFSLDGASTGEIKIGVAIWGAESSSRVEFRTLPAARVDSPAVALVAPRSPRTLDVIARSAAATPLDSAQVLTLSGKRQAKTYGDLMSHRRLEGVQLQFANPIVGEAIPKSAIGKTKPGDLIAHLRDVSPGEISVCVIGINGDLSDPIFARKIAAHRDELLLQCAWPATSDEVIVVEVPPQKRLD